MKTSRNEKHTEQQEISGIPPNITLNTLLENTKKRMGDEKFFTYNAVSNNCQDFLLAFLQSNNLGSHENYTFVKQDTEKLSKRCPARGVSWGLLRQLTCCCISGATVSTIYDKLARM